MGTILDELTALIDTYDSKVEAGVMTREDARLHQDAILGLLERKRLDLAEIRREIEATAAESRRTA